MIEAALIQVVAGFLRNHLKSRDRVFILNNECKVVMQVNQDGSRSIDCDGQPAASIPDGAVMPEIRERGEDVDDRTHSVYAARVDLVPGQSSLVIVLLNGAG